MAKRQTAKPKSQSNGKPASSIVETAAEVVGRTAGRVIGAVQALAERGINRQASGTAKTDDGGASSRARGSSRRGATAQKKVPARGARRRATVRPK